MNKRQKKVWYCFTLLAFFLLLSGCATHRQPPPIAASQLIIKTPAPEDVPPSFAPAFLIQNAGSLYNHIGTPLVQGDENGLPVVTVDPTRPTIFFDKYPFTTAKGSYTNLVYRIHFEQVPFDLDHLHLTAGTNPGILVIYTVDDKTHQLLLITTVHSCGCYLAFVPTTAMPQTAFPEQWPQSTQDIYGYRLPSIIDAPRQDEQTRLLFRLEAGTHRIGFIESQRDDPTPGNETIARLQPIDDLYTLPFGGRNVSFFEMNGPRQGYVKNNEKPLERLMIGWWAFDFKVGQDKAFAGPDTSSVIFYTSLKFWARGASNLKNFPGFLAYWGWNL